LQKKHSKHSKETQKEKNKTSTELQDSFTEIQRLQTKLEVSSMTSFDEVRTA
jgi:hypothetical protein